MSAVAPPWDETRAGNDETFWWPPDRTDPPQVAYFVTGDEFARYATDLDKLTGVASGRTSGPRVSELRDHSVVGFLERRVVASTRLDPRHASLLGRTG